jgi:hypothetical protein
MAFRNVRAESTNLRCAVLVAGLAAFGGCGGSSNEDAGVVDARVSTDAQEPLDTAVVSCVTPDADGDGHDAVACGGSDCDDANDARYPGAIEVCDPDDVDEDCNLATFGTTDVDGDGYVDAACCNEGATRTCGTDCADTLAGIHPNLTEVCNGVDEDCDTAIDEGSLVTLYADVDGDGFGAANTASLRCAGTSGFATASTDCDDGDVAIYPGATELCDGANNDCDQATDEFVTTLYYPDTDDDGFGANTGAVSACAAPTDFVAVSGDCDDGIGAVNPDASELCNGRDDDCAGGVDDVGMATCVGMGACRRCGTCVQGDPVSSFEAAPAPNGSWDLDCDGAVSREFPSDPVSSFPSWEAHCAAATEAQCETIRAIVVPAGGASPPCGGLRISSFLNVCFYVELHGCLPSTAAETSTARCR